MSDAGSDAAKGLSEDEVGGPVAPAESENGGTPRDTVEENGLDDDEDDLFGDGGDGDEEPTVYVTVDAARKVQQLTHLLASSASSTMKNSIPATTRAAQTAHHRLPSMSRNSRHSPSWRQIWHDMLFQSPVTANSIS
jgi:hypothetical protein